MVYFFTGYPLSGKSTYARKWAEYKDLAYFSSGDFARANGMDESEESVLEQDFSLSLNEKINSRVVALIGFGDCVIDGWPRTVDQAMIADSMGVEYRLLFFVVNPLVALERMEKRGRSQDDRPIMEARTEAMIKLQMKLRMTIRRMYTIHGGENTGGNPLWLKEQLANS